MKITPIKKIILSALFIAIGMALPFLTGQVPQIGNALLPMHLPVLVAGFVLGAPLGAAVGIIIPLLRSVIFSMPPLYPTAIAMAFELCAYGFFTGFFYNLLPKKTINIYASLVLSMILGRIVWGIAQVILLSIAQSPFTFEVFMAGAFVNAVPGIILQLVFVPAIVFALRRAGILPASVKHEG